MTEPTEKSEGIEEMLRAVGIDRSKIRVDKCSMCGADVGEFRDELSAREYQISGACQGCQDELFGVSE